MLAVPRFVLDFAFAPWRLSGTVVGVLMNDPQSLAAIGDAAHAPPYKAPPREPVLYVKPRNTHVADGAVVALPADMPAVEVGANLALVVGRTACRVPEQDALAFVAGVTLVADLCVPHESLYRPSVRQRGQDGFCPIGPRVWPLSEAGDLDAVSLAVRVDGDEVHRCGTAGRVRGAARLLADVTAFMTLSPGDLLLLGSPHGAPRVGAGHRVTVAADGLGELQFTLAAEGER